MIGGGNDASVLVLFLVSSDGIAGIGSFKAGDKVRVTGIASQYCPVEPYDRGFQVVVDDPSRLYCWNGVGLLPPQMRSI